MNSKEFRQLRIDVGDDVIRGFIRTAKGSVENAESMTQSIEKGRRSAEKRGIILPPPLMDSFTMLLVAQDMIENEMSGISGMERTACVELLNALLDGTTKTWIRCATSDLYMAGGPTAGEADEILGKHHYCGGKNR